MRSVVVALFAVLCGCQPPPAPVGSVSGDTGSSGGGDPAIHLLYPVPDSGQEAVHFVLDPAIGDDGKPNHLVFDAVIWAENFTIVDPGTDTAAPTTPGRGHWHLRILDADANQLDYTPEATTAAHADSAVFEEMTGTTQIVVAATLENGNHQPIGCARCESTVEATVDLPPP